jgi:hypothetical protein
MKCVYLIKMTLKFVSDHLDVAQSSLLYDGPQATSIKIGGPRDSSSRYSIRFIIITGVIGLLCIIAAIPLTIVGTVGLRDYGFANSPLIAGIVLFGLGSAILIADCISVVLR